MPSDPYRNIAKIYDRVIEPMQAGVRRVAARVLPPEPDWQVLDVGCGTGTGLVPYLSAGCTVAGVDISQEMLDRAKDRLGVDANLQLTDGDTLPFPDDQFDLTTTTMVLHEVPEDQRSSFLREMARVTKPGGALMVIDFRFGTLRGWRGPVLRAASEIIERLSGHYPQYRSFKQAGGVPGVMEVAGLDVTREKIVAGGNVAICVVSPS
jgi:ubiquinone/menaquinone biosynthesis C-methylase UbiE